MGEERIRELVWKLVENEQTKEGLKCIADLDQPKVEQLRDFFLDLRNRPERELFSDNVRQSVWSLLRLKEPTINALVSSIFRIVRGVAKEKIPYSMLLDHLVRNEVITGSDRDKLRSFFESIDDFAKYYYHDRIKDYADGLPYLRFLDFTPVCVPAFEAIDFLDKDCAAAVEDKFIGFAYKYLCTAYITDTGESRQVDFTLNELGFELLKNQLPVAEKQLQMLKKKVQRD